MINIILRLLISVVQLYLITFIFSKIQFREGDKFAEKTALKNYLQAFLVYSVGFSVVLYVLHETIGFPREFQSTLFILGLVLLTLVWLFENKGLIKNNLKGTFLERVFRNEVNLVKENMSFDMNIVENIPSVLDEDVDEIRNKYPFHFYEPISTETRETVTAEEYKFNEKPVGGRIPKMVLQRN